MLSEYNTVHGYALVRLLIGSTVSINSSRNLIDTTGRRDVKDNPTEWVEEGKCEVKRYKFWIPGQSVLVKVSIYN